MEAAGNMKSSISQCAVRDRINQFALVYSAQVVLELGSGLTHFGVIRAGNIPGKVLPHDSAPRASPADINSASVF